jgi:hypothetical protein
MRESEGVSEKRHPGESRDLGEVMHLCLSPPEAPAFAGVTE